jgi:aminoglycoside phosphotransferase (APT) family kinase protein
MEDETAPEDHHTGTPWRRDPSELQPRLERWAKTALGDVTVPEVGEPGNGMSSDSILFTVHHADGARQGYVARLAPPPSRFPVFPQYDLVLQRRCMELVGDQTTVPVPGTPFYEEDPDHLGTPFLVMTQVDGIVPSDNPPYVFGGWVMDASPDDRRRMQTGAVSVLARLHAITPETHDLEFLRPPPDRGGDGATALDRHVGYQRWYYEWAQEGVTYPLIERTFEWLDANRPVGSPTVFNWGDSRIGNMIWRDYEPVAVLDWEMAATGPAEIDLSWMIFLHRFFQDVAERFEMPGLPDFMVRDEMIATYTELTGRPVRDLEWYDVFNALRFAIVSVRTSTRGIETGQQERPDDPDDLVMFRGLLEQMLAGTYWE